MIAQTCFLAVFQLMPYRYSFKFNFAILKKLLGPHTKSKKFLKILYLGKCRIDMLIILCDGTIGLIYVIRKDLETGSKIDLEGD